MMVFKRKQVVVLALVMMIVVAGYLQYTYRASSISVSEKENGKLGEAVYVDGQETKGSTEGNSDATVSASKQANDFFAQAKLDREIARGKDNEALKAITTDETASKDTKLKAQEKLMKIVDNSQREVRLETLIKDSGFADVVTLFGDDGSIDVIVKSQNLTSSQVAKITDVVARQANVPINKIHIKNIF